VLATVPVTCVVLVEPLLVEPLLVEPPLPDDDPDDDPNDVPDPEPLEDDEPDPPLEPFAPDTTAGRLAVVTVELEAS
jgi:hypothetical protein